MRKVRENLVGKLRMGEKKEGRKEGRKEERHGEEDWIKGKNEKRKSTTKIMKAKVWGEKE